MALHSGTLAWKIPWTEQPSRLQSMGSHRVQNDWATSLSVSCIGEENGNPLQLSCLENPRDGGTWWAAVYGVAQSRTRLKRLSSSSRASSITVKSDSSSCSLFCWGTAPKLLKSDPIHQILFLDFFSTRSIPSEMLVTSYTLCFPTPSFAANLLKSGMPPGADLTRSINFQVK